MKNDRRFSPLISLLAWVLFVCFSFQSAAYAAGPYYTAPTSMSSKDSFSRLSIPAAYGKSVKSQWFTHVNDSRTPLLIHIQDAHSNPEAQKNIALLIEHLRKQYKIDTVFVEGAVGTLDAEYLSFSKDPKENQKLHQQLTQSGAFTASDVYLSEYGNRIKFLGIEDPQAYRDDFEALKKVMSHQEDVQRSLERIKRQLDKDFTRLNNKHLLSLLRIDLHQNEEKNSAYRKVRDLDQLSIKALKWDLRKFKEQKQFPNLVRLLRLKDSERSMNLEQAKKELSAIRTQYSGLGAETLITKIEEVLSEKDSSLNPRFLMEQLYDVLKDDGFHFLNYPQFIQWIKNRIYQSELNGPDLFHEIQEWIQTMSIQLAKKPEDKEAVERVEAFHLLRKLVRLELSREEYIQIQKMQLRIRVLSSEDSLLVTMIEEALNFYRLAVLRETAFVRTIKNEINDGKRAIVISGGFHSQGFKETFDQSKWNYCIVRPSLSGDSRQSYRSLMLRQNLSPVPYALSSAQAASLGVGDRALEFSTENIFDIYLRGLSAAADRKLRETVQKEQKKLYYYYNLFGLDGLDMFIKKFGLSNVVHSVDASVREVVEVVSGVPGYPEPPEKLIDVLKRRTDIQELNLEDGNQAVRFNMSPQVAQVLTEQMPERFRIVDRHYHLSVVDDLEAAYASKKQIEHHKKYQEWEALNTTILQILHRPKKTFQEFEEVTELLEKFVVDYFDLFRDEFEPTIIRDDEEGNPVYLAGPYIKPDEEGPHYRLQNMSMDFHYSGYPINDLSVQTGLIEACLARCAISKTLHSVRNSMGIIYVSPSLRREKGQLHLPNTANERMVGVRTLIVDELIRKPSDEWNGVLGAIDMDNKEVEQLTYEEVLNIFHQRGIREQMRYFKPNERQSLGKVKILSVTHHSDHPPQSAKFQPRYVDLRQDRSLSPMPMAVQFLVEAFGTNHNVNTYRPDTQNEPIIYAGDREATLFIPFRVHQARASFRPGPIDQGGRAIIEFTDSGKEWEGSALRVDLIQRILVRLGFHTVRRGKYHVEALLDKDHGAFSEYEIRKALKRALHVLGNTVELDMWLEKYYKFFLKEENGEEYLDRLMNAWADHYERMGTLHPALSVHPQFNLIIQPFVKEDEDLIRRILERRMKKERDETKTSLNADGEEEETEEELRARIEDHLGRLLEQYPSIETLQQGFPYRGGEPYKDRFTEQVVRRYGEKKILAQYSEQARASFINPLIDYPWGQVYLDDLAEQEERGRRLGLDRESEQGSLVSYFLRFLIEEGKKDSDIWNQAWNIAQLTEHLQSYAYASRLIGQAGGYDVIEFLYQFPHDDFRLVVFQDRITHRFCLGYGVYGDNPSAQPFLDRTRKKVRANSQVHTVKDLAEIFSLNGYIIEAVERPSIDLSYLKERLRAFLHPREELSLIAVRGVPTSSGFVSGRLIPLNDRRKPSDYEGGIFVGVSAAPKHDPLIKASLAVITTTGGLMSHQATQAQENQIPGLILKTATVTSSGRLQFKAATPQQRPIQQLETEEDSIYFSEVDFGKELLVTINEGDVVTVDANRGVLMSVAPAENEGIQKILNLSMALRRALSKGPVSSRNEGYVAFLTMVLHLNDALQIKFALQEALLSLNLSDDQKTEIIQASLANSGLKTTVINYLLTVEHHLSLQLIDLINQFSELIEQNRRMEQIYYSLTVIREKVGVIETIRDLLKEKKIYFDETDYEGMLKKLYQKMRTVTEERRRWLTRTFEDLEADSSKRDQMSARQAKQYLKWGDLLQVQLEDVAPVTKRDLTQRLADARAKAKKLVTATGDSTNKFMNKSDIPRLARHSVGGKASHSAEFHEVIEALNHPQIKTLPGFAITARVYQESQGNQLSAEDQKLHLVAYRKVFERQVKWMRGLLKKDPNTSDAYKQKIFAFFDGINEKPLPQLWSEILREFVRGTDEVSKEVKQALITLGVYMYRSSGLEEDSEEKAKAGEGHTEPTVHGPEQGVRAIPKVWASGAEAILVEPMVNAISSGVAHSVNIPDGNLSQMQIAAVYGLGMSAVEGLVDPDSITLDLSRDLEIVEVVTGKKESKLMLFPTESYDLEEKSMAFIKEIKTPEAEQKKRVLDDRQIKLIGIAMRAILKEYGYPMDIEWAFDPFGTLVILQARPLTTVQRKIERGQQLFSEMLTASSLGEKNTDSLNSAEDIPEVGIRHDERGSQEAVLSVIEQVTDRIVYPEDLLTEKLLLTKDGVLWTGVSEDSNNATSMWLNGLLKRVEYGRQLSRAA